MTAKQASETLGVSLSMVYQLAREGRLPHFRIGLAGRRGKLIFDDEGIRRFKESCRVEKCPATGWIR
jgi:excisionase family DNA binding protein